MLVAGATEEEALENIRDAIREYWAAINDPALREAATERRHYSGRTKTKAAEKTLRLSAAL
jgi:predicted RNase H-like HicB family nuclease